MTSEQMTDEEILKRSEGWLSHGALCELIELVRERKAEARDAEQLRDEFVKYVENGRDPPPQLLQWLCRGFIEQRQDGGRQLGQALGLISHRGSAGADKER